MKDKFYLTIRRLMDNFDSILLVLLMLLTNLDLIFSVFNKPSVSSLCFKACFVVVGFLFAFRFFKTIKSAKSFQKIFRTEFFKYTLVALIPILACGLVVLMTMTSEVNLADYLIKYICLVFTFVYIILLITGKYNKLIPRISVLFSFVTGTTFCIAMLFPVLRGRMYTGAFSFNFPNPNSAALAICFTACNLMYGLYIARFIFTKFIFGAEVFALFFALYFTQARSPFVAIAVGFLVAIIMTKLNFKNSIITSAALVTSILLFVCVYVLSVYSASDGQCADFVDIQGLGKGLASRYGIWVEGFKRVFSKPLIGFYGAFNGQLQYHNGVFDLFVTYGIPCAVLVLCSFVYLLSKALDNLKYDFKSSKIALFCFLSCIFTGLFESSIFSSPQGLYILFFSFITFFNIPLCPDVVAESNAINFFEKTSAKVDVILINSVYKKGSTGKIVESIKRELEKEWYSVIALYGRKEIDIPEYNVVKCTSGLESIICRMLNKITKDYSLFNFYSTLNYINVIRKYKPQVVHIHCLNDDYINQYFLFRFLKRKHIKTVLTLHSENLYVGCQEGHVFECENWCNGNKCRNCKKYKTPAQNKHAWNRLNKMFSYYNELTITAVSPWLAERAKKSTILNKYDIRVVLNGVNENFVYRSEKSYLLPNNLSDKKKILFVCANAANSHKGFVYFKEIAKRFENNKSIHFICLSLEKFAGSYNDNITYLNPIKDNLALSKLYSECDISLVLSPKETFSMPTAESLSCGTLVAGFKCGGAESIADKNFSVFVEYGDIDSLCAAIKELLERDNNKSIISAINRGLYSSRRMYHDYFEIYGLEKNCAAFTVSI